MAGEVLRKSGLHREGVRCRLCLDCNWAYLCVVDVDGPHMLWELKHPCRDHFRVPKGDNLLPWTVQTVS